jgi:hypothetical protein
MSKLLFLLSLSPLRLPLLGFPVLSSTALLGSAKGVIPESDDTASVIGRIIRHEKVEYQKEVCVERMVACMCQ